MKSRLDELEAEVNTFEHTRTKVRNKMLDICFYLRTTEFNVNVKDIKEVEEQVNLVDKMVRDLEVDVYLNIGDNR